MSATIVGLPDISTGFPTLPDRLIDRPHFLSTIEAMFDGPTQIVIVEGEEGVGKTILAAQFALKYPERAFSLFVSNVSAFSRSPEFILANLCDQIHWHFHGTRMPLDANPEVYLRTARLQLQREAASKGKPFYFVVDGLLQVAAIDPALVSLVLTDYLPVGIPLFKLLLTGEADKLPQIIKDKVPQKPWTPPGFSPEETRALLEEFHLSAKVLQDINTTFGCLPGKIASIRRILQAGLDANALEDNLPRSLAHLFAIEWRSVDSANSLQLNILAALAHARHELTVGALAVMFVESTESVVDAVAPLRFIRHAPITNELSYVSNSFREFAAAQLASRKMAIIERIVDVLQADTTAAAAVEHLPGYLESLGRQKELLAYLSLDHLAVVCEKMHSLQPAIRMLRHGFLASVTDVEPAAAFKFAFQLGMVADIGAASVLSSEVAARLAVGEDALALSLVQGALLREDRLEGLATIVKSTAARGERPDPAILAEVRSLAETVDFSSNSRRAVSVASQIIVALPDVAISLVERSTSANSDWPADVAYATLAILAQDLKREQEQDGVSEESISTRIKSPNVRSLARTLSVVVAGYSVDDLLSRCEEMARGSPGSPLKVATPL
jgi:hypothetical protein